MRKSVLFTLVSVLTLISCQEPNPTTVIQPTDPDSSVIIVKDICGDGILTAKEICDTSLFSVSKDCRNYGFDSGEVSCSSLCQLDFSTCNKEENKEDPNKDKEDPNKEDPNKDNDKCGNGVPDDGEDCDTQYILGSCNSYDSKYMDGYVYCTNTCKFDFTQCVNKPVCGDDKREGVDEQCDTKETVGHCVDYGDYDLGEVTCSSTCKLDYSQCKKLPVCGNGAEESGEECDDGNKINTDGCTNNCKLPDCGDGIRSDSEQCDGNLFSISSCSEYNPNYDTGYLQCDSNCRLDITHCSKSPECGDGAINSTREQCEVSVPITASCTDVYEEATGFVACIDCQLDYSNCVEVCPMNRKFNDGEYISTTTQAKVVSKTDTDGTVYITYTNGNIKKIGKSVGPKVLRWISSTEGDEGYYSRYDTNCGCSTCDISIDIDSYIVKQDAVSDLQYITERYTYNELLFNDVPDPKPNFIDFPIDVQTTVRHGSCNNRYYNDVGYYAEFYTVDGCPDYSTYYMEINKDTLILSTEDFTYELNLVENLGDNLYLVYYSNGSGIPSDFNKDGIKNPYAVIRITKGDNYSVCDLDTVQDTHIEILSWSGYKDIAENHPEYSSNVTLWYKPILKYLDTHCIKPRSDLLSLSFPLTSKENYGIDNYNIVQSGAGLPGGLTVEYNRCDTVLSFTTNPFTKVGPERIIQYLVNKNEYPLTWYPSFYRDDTLVLDLRTVKQYKHPDYPNSKFDYNYSNSSFIMDVNRVEVEFSDPSDVEAYMNCDTVFPSYLDSKNNSTTSNYQNRCKFTMVHPESSGYKDKNKHGKNWTNHFNSETIKYCLVYSDRSRECVEVVPYTLDNTYQTKNYQCVSRY